LNIHKTQNELQSIIEKQSIQHMTTMNKNPKLCMSCKRDIQRIIFIEFWSQKDFV